MKVNLKWPTSARVSFGALSSIHVDRIILYDITPNDYRAVGRSFGASHRSLRMLQLWANLTYGSSQSFNKTICPAEVVSTHIDSG